MTIKDLAALDLAARLDELLDVCKPGGSAGKKCPHLSADVTRKATALKGSLARLGPALDEAGPPPVLKDRPPLYLRQSDPVVQAIAKLLGHHGVLEDTLYVLTKDLARQYGDARVSDAITELVWVHRETRWAKLRPETLRSLRPFIGPAPDAEDFASWWKGRSMEPPEPRSLELEKRKRQAKEELKPESRPAKKTRTRKKTA